MSNNTNPPQTDDPLCAICGKLPQHHQGGVLSCGFYPTYVPLTPDKRDEEIAVLRSTLKSAEAWLDRWASHVGNCQGGMLCTCGLTAVVHEVRAALTHTDKGE